MRVIFLSCIMLHFKTTESCISNLEFFSAVMKPKPFLYNKKKPTFYFFSIPEKDDADDDEVMRSKALWIKKRVNQFRINSVTSGCQGKKFTWSDWNLHSSVVRHCQPRGVNWLGDRYIVKHNMMFTHGTRVHISRPSFYNLYVQKVDLE